MTVLYVASDKPASGKTALCSSLSVLFNKHGLSSAVYKLISSQEDEEIFSQHLENFSKLLNPKNVLDSINLPKQFTIEDLVKPLKKEEENFDVLIIEAPSSQTPTDVAKTAKILDSHVLEIINFSPDMDIIDLENLCDTFSNIKFNFLINNVTKHSGHSLQKDFLDPSVPISNQILGGVPEKRSLIGISIDSIVNLVDGHIIDFNNPADHNQLINHFMVGGWSLDAGELYFGLLEQKAAIIRGDRPDMQMAALSTKTSCLILTGGFSPNQYVVLQAEDKGVTIIVTNQDTIATMELLNNVESFSRFDHSEKLKEFVDLIEMNIDTKSILELIN